MSVLSILKLLSTLLSFALQVQCLMLHSRTKADPELSDGPRRQFPFPLGGGGGSGNLQDMMQLPGMPPGFMGGLGGPSGGLDLKSYNKSEGLATLYTDPGNSMDLILDITDLLKGSGLIMVTALAAEGTYTDEQGTVMDLHAPMEETGTTIFKLVASSDNKSVDIFQPQLTMRTSDSETQLAWDKGADSPWIGKLKRMSTSLGSSKIVVDGIELIQRGFFVAPKMGSAIQSYKLTKVKSYPTNFDVSLTFLGPAGQMSVTFSIIRPPVEPMSSRVNDDRLPYFTQDYTDLGVHTRKLDKDDLDPRKVIDPSVSVIWKYDLERLPDKQIRIHVDPSVPERWHKSFKQGIEGWNVAFKEAGYDNAIRGVLPSDPDWPKDYDAGDARFNTISWAIDSSSVFSMGIAKVDPRSGEILKSDIIMGAGWVRAWLDDLHDMKPDETQELSLGLFSEKLEHHRGAPLHRAPQASLLQDGTWGGKGDAASDINTDSQSKTDVEAENERAALNLLGDRPSLSLMAMGLPKESWYEVVEAGLKSVVMHETGHILGLRHNFKGSLGVSYECTQNMTCSAEQGLTASIMDYIPMNMPSTGVEKVHLFTPVVGAYDKLAIRYGYMHLPSSVKEIVNGVPITPPLLKEVLDQANRYQNCVDGDRSAGSDPLCEMYDLTAEPLRYYEDRIRLLQKLQQKLLDTSVKPGEPYSQFGDIVESMLTKVFQIQDTLVHWVGGMNVSYVHRPFGQAALVEQLDQTAIKPISAEDQRKAVRLLLEISRPGKQGLLPSSDLISKLPYKSRDQISSMNLKAAIRSQQEAIMRQLLSTTTLKHIEMSKDFGGLSVGTFLDDLIYQVLGTYEGASLSRSTPQDWDLQMFLVKNLASKQQPDQGQLLESMQMQPPVELPESIEPHMLMATKSALRVVDAGLKLLGEEDVPAEWSKCNTGGSEMCTCHGRVRLWLGGNWSSVIDSTGSVECRPEVFGLSQGVPDAVCQCLSGPTEKASLRLHLQELKAKLKKAASDAGVSLESAGFRLAPLRPLCSFLSLAIAAAVGVFL